MSKKRQPRQAVVNIGTIGHVDHGKSTLVAAYSGTFPDTHSEEIRRGISIRLGYASVEFRACPKCPDPEKYTTEPKCPHCGTKTELLRRVAFVDAPGHEVLMATMLSGSSIMDGAVLVVAANEQVPMPQTREHLAAMEILGLTKKGHIVIAQNKIELVDKEKAIENYHQIKAFLKERNYPDFPIIPISAIHKVNLDILIKYIEEYIPTPERDPTLPALMYIARSFNINKPGIPPEDLRGGVIGGSLLQGTIEVGQEIEIRPGIILSPKEVQPLRTKIVSIQTGFAEVKKAQPGGLLGVGTLLDPSITKSDQLVGHVAGEVGKLPPVWSSIVIEVHLLERAVGVSDEQLSKIEEISSREMLMLNIGTMKTVGVVRGKKSANEVIVDLRIPVCAEEGMRIAISRQIAHRWRLIGWGLIKSGGTKLLD